ncbi:lipopolysaccharide-induced tumor necrosis factor-alpha factor homolog [Diaphorina citri]|uniref:Lipopolysaccharide-induced tumor necrosis factor-alpha factor homolog n=1 Tax=Diaphorina citri TaxID=121845 RepID=A0A1S3CZ72_DIACI|nr:lipopolysaccharide-induced tumor necrosis factor-alpha factor homolog [Diaphorina citri]
MKPKDKEATTYPPVVQQPQSATTVVITQQPAFAPGPRPMRVTCPNCHQHITTETETDCLCVAHFVCLALFLVGLCVCSCIPYCMDSCKSVSHHCPNCKVDLGTYVPS